MITVKRLYYCTMPVNKCMTSTRSSVNRMQIKSYATCKTVLNDYFKPKKNIQMEIYNFRSCIQKPGQILDD